MPSLMENIFGSTVTGGVNVDEMLAISSMNAAAAASSAYLMATLEATTPEVRRLFGEYLTQSLVAHETLTGLAIKRNWVNPYQSPEDQLKMSYQDSQNVLNEQTQPQ